MKEIELRNSPGTKFKVSDEDYDFVLSWSPWYLDPDGYVAGTIRGRPVLLHCLLLNAPDGYVVDHKNRDRTDAQRENLRVATREQNAANKSLSKRNSSGYKGVSFYKRHGLWEAKIMVNRKANFLGFFLTAEDAAIAYNDAALKFNGEFAVLNIVDMTKATGKGRLKNSKEKLFTGRDISVYC